LYTLLFNTGSSQYSGTAVYSRKRVLPKMCKILGGAY